jgi:hypothetical protein
MESCWIVDALNAAAAAAVPTTSVFSLGFESLSMSKREKAVVSFIKHWQGMDLSKSRNRARVSIIGG